MELMKSTAIRMGRLRSKNPETVDANFCINRPQKMLPQAGKLSLLTCTNLVPSVQGSFSRLRGEFDTVNNDATTGDRLPATAGLRQGTGDRARQQATGNWQ